MDFLADPDNRWQVVDSFIKRYGYVHLQLDAYNQFMSTILPSIIQENSDINITSNHRRHRIRFGDVTVPGPRPSTRRPTRRAPSTPSRPGCAS